MKCKCARKRQALSNHRILVLVDAVSHMNVIMIVTVVMARIARVR
jgi:hypothetical protein